MKEQTSQNCNFLGMALQCAVFLALILTAGLPIRAQQIFGSITGTVKDSSGAVVGDAVVTARNPGTNLSVSARSQSTGSYSISNLPAGTYELTFSKDGFASQRHT